MHRNKPTTQRLNYECVLTPESCEEGTPRNAFRISFTKIDKSNNIPVRNFNTGSRSQRLEINSDTINLYDRTLHCSGGPSNPQSSLLSISSGYNLTAFFNVVYHPSLRLVIVSKAIIVSEPDCWEIRLQVCPFIVLQNYCRFNGFRSKRIRVPGQRIQFGALNPKFPFRTQNCRPSRTKETDDIQRAGPSSTDTENQRADPLYGLRVCRNCRYRGGDGFCGRLGFVRSRSCPNSYRAWMYGLCFK